jgi:glutaredoxin-like protein
LEEVAALDPRITLDVHSIITDRAMAEAWGIERVPAIVIGRNGDTGLRYYGVPAGFEFVLLIEDLIAVSRGDSGLGPQTRAALARLTGDVRILVFATPTCPHCPKASRLAHAIAQESPRIRADVIEAMEFPALAERYAVYGVPKVVINETTSFEGALPEAAFLQYVLDAVSPPAS